MAPGNFPDLAFLLLVVLVVLVVGFGFAQFVVVAFGFVVVVVSLVYIFTKPLRQAVWDQVAKTLVVKPAG